MLTPEGDLLCLDETNAVSASSEDSNAEDYYTHEYPESSSEDERGSNASHASNRTSEVSSGHTHGSY